MLLTQILLEKEVYAFLQNCYTAILNWGEENTFFLSQTVFESNVVLKMSINVVT